LLYKHKYKNIFYDYAGYFFAFLSFIIHIILATQYWPLVPTKDEQFFYPVVLEFKNSAIIPSIQLLSSYAVPQPPLLFWLLSIIMRVHNSLILFRILNALVIAITIALFFLILKQCAPRYTRLRMFVFMVYCLNPYLHFIGTLFYTDAYYLLLVMLCLYYVVKNKQKYPYYLVLFVAPLIRQFGVYLTFAQLGEYFLNREKNINKWIAACLPLVGILSFVLLWKGLSPQHDMNKIFALTRQAYGYGYAYIVAYFIAAIGFYMSPLFLGWIKQVYQQKIFWIFGIIGMLFYLTAPARQNYYAQVSGSQSILFLGLYHQLAHSALGGSLCHILLASTAFLSAGWLAVLVSCSHVWLVLRLMIVCYLFMNYFNFQAWDKYLLDILAITSVVFLKQLNEYLDAEKTSESVR